MYLKRAKSGNKIYLYLVEETVNNNNKRRCKTIKSFGREDLIPPDQLQEIKQKYSVESKHVNKIIELEHFINKLSQAGEKEKEDNKLASNNLEANKLLVVNYGHFLIKQYLDHYFDLSRFLTLLQKNHTKITNYRLNYLVWFFISNRIINASSYLNIADRSIQFLANPLNDLQLIDYYRGLYYIYMFKDQIMKHVYKNICKTCNKQSNILLFFDCTNIYYEIPFDSEEAFCYKYQKEYIAQLISQNYSQEEIDNCLNSPEYKIELEEALEEAREQQHFIKMRGPSKEGRFAQPITGISLVIDEHGIPLDFDVFPGNKSEFEDLPKAVASIKEKYNIDKVYYVADRGLNSSSNLEMLKNNGLGFIVAQKISQQKPHERQEMLSPENWKTIDFSKDNLTNDLDKHADGATYKYKVVDYCKQSVIFDQTLNKRRKIEIDCKLIYTFSEKRKKRDLVELDRLKEKAKKAIRDGKFISNPNGTGWRSIVLTSAEITNNKTDKEKYRAIALNEEKIKNLESIAGYSAIVFLPPKGANKDTNIPDEVLAQQGYKQLVYIEDCFRVLKSNLSIRPVFLRKPEHIIGHYVLCILSLSLLRVLQLELNSKLEDNEKYSVWNIQKALEGFKVASSTGITGKPVFFDALIDINNTIKEMQLKKEANIEKDINLDNLRKYLLELANLTPLSNFEDQLSIRKKLKINNRLPILGEKQIRRLNS